jgi:enoyl-CoA hydratase/carnithine racemase
MTEGETRYECDGAIARITFDRPAARNAMTWHMYEQLAEACAKVAQDADVRVAVFRGAGGKAFVAGTDIAQFQTFTADDGVRYEATMEGFLDALEKLRVPTLAVVEGWAIGGGLAIAACCDFRIATPGARFGVPIARTLGNCLSMANYARIVASVGVANAKRLLVLGETITAEEARGSGFVLDVVEPGAVDARVTELCERLARNAPVTMRVSKEAIRRLLHAGLPGDEDLIRAAYGSEDFGEGVRAFVGKREPKWTGR